MGFAALHPQSGRHPHGHPPPRELPRQRQEAGCHSWTCCFEGIIYIKYILLDGYHYLQVPYHGTTCYYYPIIWERLHFSWPQVDMLTEPTRHRRACTVMCNI